MKKRKKIDYFKTFADFFITSFRNIAWYIIFLPAFSFLRTVDLMTYLATPFELVFPLKLNVGCLFLRHLPLTFAGVTAQIPHIIWWFDASLKSGFIFMMDIVAFIVIDFIRTWAGSTSLKCEFSNIIADYVTANASLIIAEAAILNHHHTTVVV